MEKSEQRVTVNQLLGIIAFVLVLGLFTGPWRPIVIRVSSPSNACFANMQQLHGAALQWGKDRNLSKTNHYDVNDPAVFDYLKGSRLPDCPEQGTYISGGTLGEAPKCTVHGSFASTKASDEEEMATRELRIRDFNYSLLVVLIIGVMGYLISPWSALSLERRRRVLGLGATLSIFLAAGLLHFWTFLFGWQAFELTLAGAGFSVYGILSTARAQRGVLVLLLVANLGLACVATCNLVHLTSWTVHYATERSAWHP